MVVVDRFVDGVGVGLAGAVAVDRHRNMFDEFTQLRFVIVGNRFPGSLALSLGSHNETVPTVRGVSCHVHPAGMVLRNVGQRPEPFPGLV